MDLGLTADQLALQARARAFAEKVVRPRAAAIDANEEYPWDIVKALTDARFVGMTIPPEYGGQGRSYLDAVLVIEEVAKCCTVTARIVVETNMGAVSTVMAYGSDEQKKRVPPGQYVTEKWPVLHAGSVPRYDSLDGWRFRVSGEVEKREGRPPRFRPVWPVGECSRSPLCAHTTSGIPRSTQTMTDTAACETCGRWCS